MLNMSKKKVGGLVGVLAVALITIMLVMPADTEAIVDSEGEVIEGSIAEMEEIKLGGVDQWLVIRGENKNKPVLLMLSGGPGSSEMGRFLEFNQELEKDFIVVIWEQRGCGKSYSAVENKESLTLDHYVSDVNELSEYLKMRFNKEKIYLLGHSWGTIIGTLAVKEKPENFHAYIGAAQMVNVRETDQYMYNFVLEAAKNNGDQKKVEKMITAGPPPYYGEGMLKKYQLFLTSYADYYQAKNPFVEKDSSWYNILSMFWFDEYNFMDKINFFRGMLNTFPAVYQQLQDLDFTVQAADLEVPVYYLIGRHDYTANFIEDYFEKLNAPQKKLIYFEQSHHGEIWSEADKFHQIMVNQVIN
jgi:pimeloyl-ACP methyl ester carboxylesterase